MKNFIFLGPSLVHSFISQKKRNKWAGFGNSFELPDATFRSFSAQLRAIHYNVEHESDRAFCPKQYRKLKEEWKEDEDYGFELFNKQFIHDSLRLTIIAWAKHRSRHKYSIFSESSRECYVINKMDLKSYVFIANNMITYFCADMIGTALGNPYDIRLVPEFKIKDAKGGRLIFTGGSMYDAIKIAIESKKHAIESFVFDKGQIKKLLQ